MLFPDVAAVLRIAAEVTGLPITTLARQARVDLLVAALSRPFGEVDGVERYPTVQDKIAATLEQIIRRHPFPTHNREIALVLATVILEEAGIQWSRLLDDVEAEALRQVFIAVERGQLGASGLGRWLAQHTSSPGKIGDVEPAAKPWIFIGHAMSRVEPAQRSTIDRLAHNLVDNIPTICRQLNCSWEPSVYLPAEWGWRDAYDRDSDMMMESASAFVYLEHQASSGGGLNFGWAASLGLPILHLRPEGTRSELLEQVPANVSFETYNDAADVTIGAYLWLRQKHRTIAIQPGRQRNLDVLYLPLWCATAHRWLGLDEDERTDVAATAGLDFRRVEQLIRNPRAFRSATGAEQVSLCASLGLDVGRWITGRSSGGLLGGRPRIPSKSLLERERAFNQLALTSDDRRSFEIWFSNSLIGVGARMPGSRDEWIALVSRWKAG